MTFLPQVADAEDVLQETNSVLWAKAGKFEPGTSFYAWAKAIARFEILEYSRRSAHISFVLDVDLLDTLSDEYVEVEDVSYREDALKACMNKLPERDQQLLAECCERSITVKEVARKRLRSPGSVYRSLERIRMTLLECVNRTLARDERGL